MIMLINEESYQQDPTLGWADLVSGGIEVHRAVGDHESYIREYVQWVAEQLRKCIEKAEASI
jgi:hypothetical protein